MASLVPASVRIPMDLAKECLTEAESRLRVDLGVDTDCEVQTYVQRARDRIVKAALVKDDAEAWR